MNSRTSLVTVLALATTLCLPLPAQQPGLNTTAYRASVSQDQLQHSTARMKADLVGLIRDYERYDITAMEIAKLKESVASLDQLTARDMPGVVRQLLAASHAADAATARKNLSTATGAQKEIQTRLRSLADQLALYSDQAAMLQRIGELAVRQAANLRATRYLTKQLAALGSSPAQLEQEPSANAPRPDRGDREAIRMLELKQRLRADSHRRKTEQAALEQEIRLAVAALAKVAADPMATAATHFTQALQAATAGKLDEHSRQATVAMNDDLPRATAEQQEIFGTLQTMIASLDAAKSDEERLRDLATQLGDLALKEDGLAGHTPRMWGEEKTRATQDQLSVADSLEVLQHRIKPLNSETAAAATQSATRAGEIGERLRPESFRDDIPLVAKTADEQRALANDLTAMRMTLEQQADQLAALASATSGRPPDPMAMSPEAAAIQAAMQQLVDARIQVELAGRQNDNRLDFQPRLAQGRQNLAAGSQQAREAGAIVPEQVHQHLAEADRLAQLAADGKLVDHHLYHTRANIIEALAGLQDAANLLAAQEAKQGAGQGESVTHSASPGGGPVYSALGAASEAQRDALSLLKQEKTAPEYESMVNQYIMNLATEPDSDP